MVRAHGTAAVSTTTAYDTDRTYQEGIVAGLVSAATVMVWVLLVDAVMGRPFETASALGMVLFDRLHAVDSFAPASVSFEMAVMFIWLRALTFITIGGVAAHLVGRIERNPRLGFGILLLAVIFAVTFTAGSMIVALPILKARTWPVILMGNVFGAAAMAAYFWRRHPQITINP